MTEKDRLKIPEESLRRGGFMGTGGRTGRGKGKGHFILGGWRKDVRITDMGVGRAAACGGRGRDRKTSRLRVLTAAVK